MMFLTKLIVFLVQKLLYYQKTAKITQKFNGTRFLNASDTAIKLLLDLNEDLPKLTLRTLQHFWFRENCATSLSNSFLCLHITIVISKIRKHIQHGLFFPFNVSPSMKRCYFRKKFA